MRQLPLALPNTWGGRRPGAGRKRRHARPHVSHGTRPYHDRAHPVHVTLRSVPGLPSLRGPRLFPALHEGLGRASGARIRVCHFSVQPNHVHLLVEAKDRQALSRGVQGLAIRLARAVNRILARRGRVFADRYHRHDLATPQEVRNALHYVLNNARKHIPGFTGPDPCSSAWGRGPVVVSVPRTWLLRVGWRRASRGAEGSAGIATSPLHRRGPSAHPSPRGVPAKDTR